MPISNSGKLEKLTIEAYTDEGRKTPADPRNMVVMFNPTTYKRTHAIAYESAKRQAINTPGKPARYAYTPPGDVAFDFILDGTGVSDLGPARPPGRRSIKQNVARFEQLCLKMNGDIHQPNFLLIRWGDLTFSGRLKTLTVTYSLFDEAGDPIRAKLEALFVEDKSVETIFREAGKNSADVTHVRMVKSGDTLPLLCKQIYGSSAHYLDVARHNGLDDFRNLTPGRTLTFPPLQRGGGESAT